MVRRAFRVPSGHVVCPGYAITGLVLTKMDSTAKGGMIFSIWDELKIPVKLVCFGQQLDDIDFYSPQRVVDASLGITAW